MTFSNLALGAHRLDVNCGESATTSTHTIVNRTGNAVAFDTYIRITPGRTPRSVTRNGSPIAYTFDAGTGRVHVTGSLATGVNAATAVQVDFRQTDDIDADGDVDATDAVAFDLCVNGPDVLAPPAGCDPVKFARADLDGDGDVDLADVAAFQRAFGG
jgi:hypothetical protein